MIEHLLQVMAKYMIGRSAYSIRHTAQVIFDDFAMRRTSLDLMSAWSAIEIAMWDIVAKASRPAAVQFARRPSRERVKVYSANGWSSEPGNSIEANLERALKVKEAGFTALKWDPFPGPWRNFIHREDEDHVVRYVRRMQGNPWPRLRVIGGGASPAGAHDHAIRIGQRLAEFDIGWIRGAVFVR